MINEVKRRLDVDGEVELECIDKDGFINSFRSGEEILKLDKIVIVEYQDEDDYLEENFVLSNEYGSLDLCFYLSSGELKYFKIKEQEPTFNDLIDVAVQAYKDRALRAITVENCSILITKNDYGKTLYKKGIDSYSEAINWVNSLYAETFVIENERNIARIKKLAKITLKNGNEVIAESDCLYYGDVRHIKTTYGLMNFHLNFMTLKGATVTQRKGIDND